MGHPDKQSCAGKLKHASVGRHEKPGDHASLSKKAMLSFPRAPGKTVFIKGFSGMKARPGFVFKSLLEESRDIIIL